MENPAQYCDEIRFFSGSDSDEDDVNELLASEWVLLAVGMTPHGYASYLVGHDPHRIREDDSEWNNNLDLLIADNVLEDVDWPLQMGRLGGDT